MERGGSPAEPQFGRRNPEWLAPKPTPEVSSAKQQKYSQGLHQSWCPACDALRRAPPAAQEREHWLPHSTSPQQHGEHTPFWCLQLDLARGYGHPALHSLSPGMRPTPLAAMPWQSRSLNASWAMSDCTRTAHRAVAAAAVPAGVDVGAVRISASGRERSIVEGLKVGQPSTCLLSTADSASSQAGEALCLLTQRAPHLGP